MYAIIDVETTGFGGENNRITEIAVVIHNGTTLVDEYHTLVNPEMPISRNVIGLTGIDDGMVHDAPKFSEIAEKIEQLTANKIFVAHNVNFDYNVIRNEFKRLGIDYKRKRLCTVRLSRQIFPGLRSYSLGNLCRNLEIPIQQRHRAKGDTDATVILLQKLLKNDQDGTVAQHLNQRSREVTLPPLLPKTIFEELPETSGVYYFLNDTGNIIYVGKAVNIKKRVLSHFYDKKAKELALSKETAHIEFEETGSELLALIVESVKIKHHFPKYNRAQKRRSKGYGVFSYTDRKGIIHLAYNHLKLVKQPIKVFYSTRECVAFMEQLCEAYNLCPKYTQLQSNVKHCSHYKLNECKGICREEEVIDEYNNRVQQAIAGTKTKSTDFLLIEKGRTPKEKAVILIEDEHYRGHGFIPNDQCLTTINDLEAWIELQPNNREIDHFIKAYMDKVTNKVEIVQLPS
ncbi:exonuclease domain-containing protein [Zhouia amylolytica]|uniref:Exonuclease, DNA polymerase III, epsilon subunit family n=1 Tax=Zhouia amylolytica AD3 TaxID=1286632 RepID=W2UQP3_9FLAO|nr:exonuclease domain-containing protein [Zhouia amylolytica]ETN96254.1 exonuclease, DNA polymerase III, epsilon subunit family [Zhouia amylolytica AD3]